MLGTQASFPLLLPPLPLLLLLLLLNKLLCHVFQVTRNPLDPLRHTLYYLRADDVIHEETPSQVIEGYYNTTDPLHRRASNTARHGSGGEGLVAQPLARKTIQVAGVC
jgi:hypothetical protein